MPFDFVFRDAVVVDGTGADRFVADVAVEGDRIVEVGTVTGGGSGRKSVRSNRVCSVSVRPN